MAGEGADRSAGAATAAAAAADGRQSRKREREQKTADNQANLDVLVQPISGSPFSVSVAADSKIFQVKDAVRELKGHAIVSMKLFKEDDEDPCPNCEQIFDCFGTKAHSLSLLITDQSEISALVDLQTDGWLFHVHERLRVDMDIDEVAALQLDGIIINDCMLVQLDLSHCEDFTGSRY